MQELRIIIAGGRDFDDWNLLKNVINNYLKVTNPSYKAPVIISGCAKGADKLGEHFAEYFDFDLKRFPANWEKYGKSAGMIRNTEMAKYAMADESHGVLFAFWNGRSKGTKHMIDIADRFGLEVHVIRYDEKRYEIPGAHVRFDDNSGEEVD